MKLARIVPFVLAAVTATATGNQARADEAGAGASIYALNPVIDGSIIAAGAVAVIVPYALTSRLITPSCPCSSAGVNAFDRGAIGQRSDAADWLSTVTVGLALVAPPVADWLALRTTRVWVEDVGVLVEALAVDGALVTAAKYVVQRPIPRAYSDPALARAPSSYRSFYSGHTATAFTALAVASVTVERRYGLTWEPWVLTFVVGASVAAERVVAGRHFTSDVLVGAAVGTGVGVGVSAAHLRSRGVALAAWAPERGSGFGLRLAGSLFP